MASCAVDGVRPGRGVSGGRHVLVTYDAEESIAVGQRGDEGAASAAEGLVVFGGAALRAESVNFVLQGVDDVG